MADDFASLHKRISSALVSTTRSTSALANEDLPFHRSLDNSLGLKLDKQNARLLGLASGLLGTARPNTDTVRGPPSLKDVEGIENNWRAVVDVVDSLLERADTALDEFTGAVKRLSPGTDVQVGAARARAERSKTDGNRMLAINRLRCLRLHNNSNRWTWRSLSLVLRMCLRTENPSLSNRYLHRNRMLSDH